LVVRTAERSDAKRLARINIDAWRAAYTGIVAPARLEGMRLEEYVERWQRTPADDGATGRTVLVAELDGVIASYCTGGPYRPQEGLVEYDAATWGEVYAIYTDPPLQGRGAGSAVHDAFVKRLRSHGYKTAALWVLEANERARRWYTNRGWRPDGAVTDWVSVGVAHPEIRLRLDVGNR
jgi:GNAT superfamily N-acetyltransferase